MICEKCDQEKTEGGRYYFRFSEILERKTEEGFYRTHITTKYRIRGERSAWICDDCLKKFKRNESFKDIKIGIFLLVLGIVPTIFLWNFIYSLHELAPFSLMALSVIGIVFLVDGFKHLREKPKKIDGENFAFRLKKPELEKEYGFPIEKFLE